MLLSCFTRHWCGSLRSLSLLHTSAATLKKVKAPIDDSVDENARRLRLKAQHSRRQEQDEETLEEKRARKWRKAGRGAPASGVDRTAFADDDDVDTAGVGRREKDV